MSRIKKLIEKDRVGDALDDTELGYLLEHYRYLSEVLSEHGEMYHLVWKDTYEKWSRLAGYKRARKEK